MENNLKIKKITIFSFLIALLFLFIGTSVPVLKAENNEDEVFYTYRFEDWDRTLIQEVQVREGEFPVLPDLTNHNPATYLKKDFLEKYGENYHVIEWENGMYKTGRTYNHETDGEFPFENEIEDLTSYSGKTITYRGGNLHRLSPNNFFRGSDPVDFRGLYSISNDNLVVENFIADISPKSSYDKEFSPTIWVWDIARHQELNNNNTIVSLRELLSPDHNSNILASIPRAFDDITLTLNYNSKDLVDGISETQYILPYSATKGSFGNFDYVPEFDEDRATKLHRFEYFEMGMIDFENSLGGDWLGSYEGKFKESRISTEEFEGWDGEMVKKVNLEVTDLMYPSMFYENGIRGEIKDIYHLSVDGSFIENWNPDFPEISFNYDKLHRDNFYGHKPIVKKENLFKIESDLDEETFNLTLKLEVVNQNVLDKLAEDKELYFELSYLFQKTERISLKKNNTITFNLFEAMSIIDEPNQFQEELVMNYFMPSMFASGVYSPEVDSYLMLAIAINVFEENDLINSSLFLDKTISMLQAEFVSEEEAFALTFLNKDDEIERISYTNFGDFVEGVDYFSNIEFENYSNSLDYFDYETFPLKLIEPDSYIVQFLDLKGEVINTQTVVHGESAIVPNFEQELFDRILVGWEGNFDNITEDKTFIAKYELKELYTITFKNIDDSIVEILELYEGQKIDFPEITTHPENPSKYSFTGWVPLDSSHSYFAEKDQTYKAIYELTIYNISFMVDGEILFETPHNYGDYELGNPHIYAFENKYPDRYITGYSQNFDFITGDLTIEIFYEFKEVYTITFKNIDGSIIETFELYEGQEIEIPQNIIHPENELRFSFVGWGEEVDSYASKDVEYIAEFKENIYTVKFLDLRGSVVEQFEIVGGQSVEVPEFEQELFDRIFTGWDGNFESITSDIEFEASFEMKDLFTVVFRNIDETIISEIQVYDGEIIEPPKNVLHPEDPERYEIVYWTDLYPSGIVKSNMEVYPIYQIKKFTVSVYIFEDFGNKYKFLQNYKVEYGNDLELEGSDTIDKFFVEWDKELTNIKEDIVLHAIYQDKELYTINFVNIDGSILKTIEIYEGNEIKSDLSGNQVLHPENPDKYIFENFEREGELADSNANLEAIYSVRFFLVEFLNISGNVIERQSIYYGEDAIPPKLNDTKDKFFEGWGDEIYNITSKMTISPIYKNKEIYTIAFLNYDKSVISSREYYEGDEIELPENVSFASGQTSFEYIFAGWDKKVDEIASKNATYQAMYDVVERYKITFKDEEGNVINEQLVLKNSMPIIPEFLHPENPEKYVQNLDKKLEKATEDATYIIGFELREFEVKFVFDYNGKTIKSEKVKYGDSAKAPETNIENMVFDYWDVDFDHITQNTIVTGYFKEYNIYFIDQFGNILLNIDDFYGQRINLGQRYKDLLEEHDLHLEGKIIERIYYTKDDVEYDVEFDDYVQLKAGQSSLYTLIYRDRKEYRVDFYDWNWDKTVISGEFQIVSFPYRIYEGYEFSEFVNGPRSNIPEGTNHVGWEIQEEGSEETFFLDLVEFKDYRIKSNTKVMLKLEEPSIPHIKNLEIGVEYSLLNMISNKYFENQVLEDGEYNIKLLRKGKAVAIFNFTVNGNEISLTRDVLYFLGYYIGNPLNNDLTNELHSFYTLIGQDETYGIDNSELPIFGFSFGEIFRNTPDTLILERGHDPLNYSLVDPGIEVPRETPSNPERNIKVPKIIIIVLATSLGLGATSAVFKKLKPKKKNKRKGGRR